ncbi:Sulfite reductase (NADPH) flavoprotein alpha-component [Methylophaga frappieri]|uniref:Sulfite reductase [NADPH] flavoprotein alpha-component n=1 Tax=Methylophaga frappieri (strain ATCC BAA-2434 / DSM 25690 / JAM7) TaxID=754477 RepID=I1YFQ9_METFJ|nr:sulfite reductase subunit alpha [Methylophaga frappieri]AFJ01752.1 Sulfite reductase (NADPH) flavoprotein alpha-component [Methylophaga frappieri]
MKKMVNGEQVENKEKTVPFLPGDLPFNNEQKQWMGGFLAGLHTRLLVKEENVSQAAAPVAARPITILYGSQTGNAESCAEDAAEMAKAHGLSPIVMDMDDADLAQLATTERLLIVCSTYGEGEMPDNAQSLWDAISAEDAPGFANTYYSVLALGDTNYDGFCVAGKMWDERLAELGAKRIADRVDCDVDFAGPAENWMSEALPTIAQKGSDQAGDVGKVENKPKKEKSKYNRQNPLEAELTAKRVLNKAGSSKEIVHYEFSLHGSGEHYEAGDALNVIPRNRPDLVSELLTLLNADDDQIEPYNGQNRSLKTLLTEEFEIRLPSKELLAELALRTGDAELNRLLENNDKEALDDFLWGKDIVDLLRAYPAELTPAEFLSLCKPLAPRAYSISSSINKHNESVHLTISSVRYNKNDREHHGVCSTFLMDVAEVGDKVKCYFSPNKNFAVPADDDLPMIMVGPGTGIAPFRAFLEEREVREAKGPNWLFFGDRNSATDYIYEDEITAMQKNGLLTRLDLAFSRDQEEKIYVQDRMRENGEELFKWLEQGGYFYICGDAYRMAKDVDVALHDVIAEHGGMSAQAAQEYVTQLKKQKRYVRDVY